MKNKKIIIGGIILFLILISSFFIFIQISNKKYLFEAKIGDELIFSNKNILFVSKTNITSCSQFLGGYDCEYEILFRINNQASNNYAMITSKLSNDNSRVHCRDINGNPTMYLYNPLNCPENSVYSFFVLNESLDFYWNNTFIGGILIPESLKGKKVYEISFNDYSTGKTVEEAYNNTEKNITLIKSYL